MKSDNLDDRVIFALIKTWKLTLSRGFQFYDLGLISIGVVVGLFPPDRISFVSDEERYRIIYFIKMFEMYH